MKSNMKYIFVSLVLLTLISGCVILLNIYNQNNIPGGYSSKQDECKNVKSSYVGLSEKDAINKANNENRIYRVIMRDDDSFPVTTDYLPDRLNFVINNNLVKKASCG